jgi:hypothetical protein
LLLYVRATSTPVGRTAELKEFFSMIDRHCFLPYFRAYVLSWLISWLVAADEGWTTARSWSFPYRGDGSVTLPRASPGFETVHLSS